MAYSSLIKEVFGKRAEKGPLFSFWTHFPQCDMDPAALAEASIENQKKFDLDFVKAAPNGMYTIEDYGVDVDFSEVPKGGIAKLVDTPFKTASDWKNLQEIEPDTGALAREVQSIKIMRQNMPDVPIFFSSFSPMTTASKLSNNRIREQLKDRENAPLIHEALSRIASTTQKTIAAAIEAGATGVFFAHQDTSRELFSYDDFSEFVAPYDHEALLGAAHAPFNILHIHGSSIRFNELLDYNVQAFNWHAWETLPSTSAGLMRSGRCVLSGIDRRSITNNDLDALKHQVKASIESAQGFGDLILTPSCIVRAGFNEETVRQLSDYVHSYRIGVAA
ncbi:uroporphyrinogen decarboxylase [Cohaesibacter sp. ES.047]|uniref:uroporphyrinogen decarboxylase family protein n=1 Tax=Cohaesibacter sp. ES.047 TaxID=1798205 RepID=UPI000BB68441|nr:uroporphyrinogen decarboxylase family protein [Cohaesibacter sp. ES.047]SNY93372.1 uroporphyrinogen decarboxylase [Cohaesibacter sp. ES.047]